MSREARQARNDKYEVWLAKHKTAVYVITGIVVLAVFVAGVLMDMEGVDSPARFLLYGLVGALAATSMQARRADKARRDLPDQQ